MKTRARSERGAFTLIEVLIVITIMVALMALTAGAVLKFLDVQQATNTQSTLDRVQSQLTRAWSKVKDAALKEPINLAVYLPIQTNLAGTDANAANRIRVIYVKLKLRQAFPMNFAEALNTPYTNPSLGALGYNPTVPASPLPPLPGYVSYLANLGIKSVANGGTVGGPAYVPQAYESSVCLLMALQRGVSGAGINPSELMAGGAAGSLATPFGNLPYLTDAWGRPIFFSRAPAGSLYLNPIGAPPAAFPNFYPQPAGPVTCDSRPGANDPGDPQGYLQAAAWGTTYGPLFTQLTLQVLAAANSSYKLAPVVASGGAYNWTKSGGVPPLDPITFYAVPGGGAIFSTPQ